MNLQILFHASHLRFPITPTVIVQFFTPYPQKKKKKFIYSSNRPNHFLPRTFSRFTRRKKEGVGGDEGSDDVTSSPARERGEKKKICLFIWWKRESGGYGAITSRRRAENIYLSRGACRSGRWRIWGKEEQQRFDRWGSICNEYHAWRTKVVAG